jgi:putative colanic acid biosynthesis glycosyltransferase
VVAFDTAGSGESIDESCGIITSKGDIQAVFNAICEIQNKGKAFYNAACRLRACKLYNKDDCFNKYLNLYHSVYY